MIELGIIGAMASEVALLKNHIEDLEVTHMAGSSFYTGTLYGLPVVLARSGVGKINATICAQIICHHFKARKLINIGVAGGLVKDMQVGDLVISTAVMHHDIDPAIFETTKETTKQKKNDLWPGFFSGDPWLIEETQKACEKMVEPHRFRKVYKGHIVSGDWFIKDSAKKMALQETYNGLCAEMEGAAIGQVAAANKTPFVVIRAISDMADEGATDSFLNFEIEAAEKAAKVIEGVIHAIQKTL